MKICAKVKKLRGGGVGSYFSATPFNKVIIPHIQSTLRLFLCRLRHITTCNSSRRYIHAGMWHVPSHIAVS